MAQPFMVRPPLELLQIFGNNLPALAQAAQEGRVTTLEATLAAQKFHQMQAAGQSAQGPTQTVAEKLLNPQAPPPPMGGVGAPPPMPPQGPPAGLGATPEAAQMQPPMPEMPAPQMPAPQMPAPEMPMEGAPMGMAEGGLTTLPLPDTMFDEPEDGSYADGGIVAFSAGGYGSYFEDVATKAVPGLGVTSRQRTDAQNKAANGVANSFHKTGDARDFVPPKGMSMAAFHAKLKREFGPQYDVLNRGTHVHVEPGPGLAKSGQGLLNPAQAANPKTPIDVPGGNLSDQMMPAFERAGDFYDKFMPKPKTEARDKLKARVEEGMSEESQKKEKNYDKWATLAEIGFNIAGSNSPNFLQAVGAAASAALPGAKKAKETREARFDKYLSQYAEIEGIENGEARERVKFMLDFGKIELDLKDKDYTRGVNYMINKMQDATTNRSITVTAATSRANNADQITAGREDNKEKKAQSDQANIKQAFQQAQADVQALLEWQKGDKATKDAIFKERFQTNLAIIRSGGGTGTPGLPSPDFEIDQ